MMTTQPVRSRIRFACLVWLLWKGRRGRQSVKSFVPLSVYETSWLRFGVCRCRKKRMSFQDIEAGTGTGRQSLRLSSNQSQDEWSSQGLASGIFQINTAVSSFYRLVNSLGTPKDTLQLREKLYIFILPLFLYHISPPNWLFRKYVFWILFLIHMILLVGTRQGSILLSWWRILHPNSSKPLRLTILHKLL